MTDTPNKIEEIRKALEGYQATEVYGPLIPLSPDMARIVLAAEKLARAVDIEANKAGMDHSVLQELAAYRKAVEGRE